MSEISKLDRNLIIRKIDSETINIQITNNTMLMSIVGQFDQNLKELEKLTNTVIFFRGNSITCKGKKANLKDFSEAIKFLINKYLLTNFIEKGDIVSEGDVLCVIEAMKLFNEIESEHSGKIIKILVDDASPVEFDQPLFLVDPS